MGFNRVLGGVIDAPEIIIQHPTAEIRLFWDAGSCSVCYQYRVIKLRKSRSFVITCGYPHRASPTLSVW